MNNAGDEKSKLFFKLKLEQNGFTVYDWDSKIEKGVKRGDLIATKNGKTYYFELKQRYVRSDKFNDIMITLDKQWLVDTYGDNVFFVFFYINGVGYVLKANTPPDETGTQYMKETTRFRNNEPVLKHYASWKPERAKRFIFNPENVY